MLKYCVANTKMKIILQEPNLFSGLVLVIEVTVDKYFSWGEKKHFA